MFFGFPLQLATLKEPIHDILEEIFTTSKFEERPLLRGVYFASGTPDPQDVRDGRVDIEGSVWRELEEEMGLSPRDVSFDPGFTLVMDAVRVGFMKRVRAPEPAAALVARIEAFLKTEREPELARLHVVRSVAEIGPAVQLSAASYLKAKLAR